MPWFVLKRGPDVPTEHVTFVAGIPAGVTDEALIRKLKKHKSFEEVPGG